MIVRTVVKIVVGIRNREAVVIHLIGGGVALNETGVPDQQGGHQAILVEIAVGTVVGILDGVVVGTTRGTVAGILVGIVIGAVVEILVGVVGKVVVTVVEINVLLNVLSDISCVVVFSSSKFLLILIKHLSLK